MKTLFTFILLLIFALISTAQNSKYDIIEESISIIPFLSLIDFSDKSFTIDDKSPKFNAFKYSQNLTHQLNGANIDLSATEEIIDGFLVFSPKNLKKSFF